MRNLRKSPAFLLILLLALSSLTFLASFPAVPGANATINYVEITTTDHLHDAVGSSPQVQGLQHRSGKYIYVAYDPTQQSGGATPHAYVYVVLNDTLESTIDITAAGGATSYKQIRSVALYDINATYVMLAFVMSSYSTSPAYYLTGNFVYVNVNSYAVHQHNLNTGAIDTSNFQWGAFRSGWIDFYGGKYWFFFVYNYNDVYASNSHVALARWTLVESSHALTQAKTTIVGIDVTYKDNLGFIYHYIDPDDSSIFYYVTSYGSDTSKPYFGMFDYDTGAVTVLATGPSAGRYSTDRQFRFITAGQVENGTLIYQYWVWTYTYVADSTSNIRFVEHRIIYNNSISADTIVEHDVLVSTWSLGYVSPTDPTPNVGARVNTNATVTASDFNLIYGKYVGARTVTMNTRVTVSDWFDADVASVTTQSWFLAVDQAIQAQASVAWRNMSWHYESDEVTDHTLRILYGLADIDYSPSEYMSVGEGGIEGDWDGWVFAEDGVFYGFYTTYQHSWGYSYLDNCLLKFNDSLHEIELGYDQASALFYISNGTNWVDSSDYITLRSGTVTVVNATSIQVKWDISFKLSILDYWNVSLFAWANSTTGVSTIFWNSTLDAGFSIYSTGGRIVVNKGGTNSGNVAGDHPLALYAGGNNQIADLWQDGFISGDFGSEWYFWEPYTTKIEVQNAWFLTSDYDEYGAHMQTTNTYYSAWMKARWIQSSFNYSYKVQFYINMSTNDHPNLVWFGLGNTSKNADNINVWFGYGADYDGVYCSDVGAVYDTTTAWLAATWYNVTLDINYPAKTYDLYLDDVLIANDMDFRWTETSDRIAWYQQGGIDETKDTYIDHIRIFRVSPGGNGGDANAIWIGKNMQHFHTNVALGIPDGDSMVGGWDPAVGFPYYQHFSEYQGSSYVEYGIDYLYEATWTNAIKCRVEYWDSGIELAENYVVLKVTWYRGTTVVSIDYIYSYYEGWGGTTGTEYGNATADWTRVWIDLWFDSANGSRMVGGRVSSYYYAIQDNQPWYLRPFVGSNIGPMMQSATEAFELIELHDKDGDVISANQLKLMKLMENVYCSESYAYRFQTQNYDELGLSINGDSMTGITTPARIPPIMPTVPLGPWAWIMEGLKMMGDAIGHAFWWMGFNLWGALVGFLDTIATWLGFPGGFSTLMTYITSLWEYVAQAASILWTFLASIYAFISGPFLSFVTAFVTMIGYVVTTLNSMITYLSGIGATMPMFTNILIFLAILTPFYELHRMEKLGFAQLFIDLQLVMNMVSFVVNLSIQVIKLFLDLVGRLIESIPMIE